MEYTKKLILAFIIGLTASPDLAYGTVIPIHKGDVATTDGFLFDHTSENQAEQDRADAEYYKALSDKQADKITIEQNESTILEQRLQLYIKESNTLAKDKASSDFNEKLLLFGSFSLGTIITALIVRNVRN